MFLSTILLFCVTVLSEGGSVFYSEGDLRFLRSLMSSNITDQWSDLRVLDSALLQETAKILGPLYQPQLALLKDINHEDRQTSQGSRYCDKDLGCFGAGDPDFWSPLYRPVNLQPRSREAINTRYLLYTRRNPNEPHTLRPSSNGTSLTDFGPFSPTKSTEFIVPGWIDRPSLVDWMKDLTTGLLLRGDHNVVLVDWSGGNGPPYTLAAANARVVGAELALLISNMQASGADLNRIHVIGHSLGAHVAGYAGQRLKGLGRITGLDPAGPYFQGMPPSVRLDPSDALLVDVWHTDGGPLIALGLGLDEASGHVDFYPNGGKTQPGCKGQRFSTVFTEGLIMGIRRFLGCNHERAIQLYLDATHSTPDDQCSPSAFPCSDWESFNAGHCAACQTGTCLDMSLDLGGQIRTNSNRTLTLFLRTADRAPFCLHHYQVSVQLSQSGPDRRGRMYLKLNDKVSTLKVDLGDKSESLHPGATYKFLVTSREAWPLSGDVTLEWRSSELSLTDLFVKPKLLVKILAVKPMNGQPKTSRTGRIDDDGVWRFLPPGGVPLYSRKPLLLSPMD